MKICADSSFLIALYDETDGNHQQALECFEANVEKGRHALLLPWPVMYESISTRMARAPRRMQRIDAHLKSLRTREKLALLDDSPFRDVAIRKCFPDETRGLRYRALSLVDIVIREVLSNNSPQTHALATFNVGDFYDVCRKFRKKMLPEAG